jgi:Tol biopolymer transport system component
MDETGIVRFTLDPHLDGFPIWSPDGREIAFRSNRTGTSNIYTKPSDNSASEQQLLASPTNAPMDYSPDGKFLLFMDTSNLDMQVLPLQGERTPQLFFHSEFTKVAGRFSPDGRWIAYHSGESGRPEIYVRPFPGPGAVSQISAEGGVGPRWAPNGKELFYIAPDGKLMAAPITFQGNTLLPGTPVALFQTRIVGGGTNGARAQYDIAPDGRILMNVALGDNATAPITLLMNWKPATK